MSKAAKTPVSTYSEPTIEEREAALVGLLKIMHMIGSREERERLKPHVESILASLRWPLENASWLTGARIMFNAPRFVIERAESMGVIKPDSSQSLSGVPPKFISLEWRSTGDEILTFYPLAAQEIMISEGSLRVRMSLGKGMASLTRRNDETGLDDLVEVRRLNEQPHPSERAALIEAAQARLKMVLARRAEQAAKLNPKWKRDASAKPHAPYDPTVRGRIKY